MSDELSKSPLWPVFIAATEDNWGKVKALLEANPELISHKLNDSTPLIWAVQDGVVDLAEWLLARGAEMVSLSSAPTKEMAALLLAHGAEVNPTNNPSRPLISAASSGCIEVVEFLLAHQADVNAKFENGSTALHFAAFSNYVSVTKLLLAAGADVNPISIDDGRTPLHWTLDYKTSKEMVELLLAHGADVNATDNHAQTPLHIAVLNTKTDPIGPLLAHGARMDIRDNRGKTPLQWAVIHDKTEIVNLLRQHGAHDDRPPVPIARTQLTQEIILAAKALEQQLRAKRVKTRKVPLVEWNQLPLDAHDLIPKWLPTLLADFSLHGGTFELPNHKEESGPLYFAFLGPAELKDQTCGKQRYCFVDEFYTDGFSFLCDAWQNNGDVWLADISTSSGIYYFDLSGHERIHAANDISELMKRMTVYVE